jgi:carbon storage regulator
VDEEVIINGNIRLVVVEVRGERVRIGVDAPKEISVDRGEVFEAKTGKRVCDVFDC